MVSPMADPVSRPPAGGLTEDEAMDFSKGFTMGIIGFILIAAIAHYLVWQWRPWIPGAEGYPAAVSAVTDAARAIVAHLA